MIPNVKLTSKGEALLAKVPAGAAVPVTKWQIGTGALAAGSSLDRAALVAPLKDLPISSVGNEGNTATILGQFTNAGMEAFSFEELGLLATDPDEGEVLFCYGNAFGAGEQIQAGTAQLREFIFGTELTFSGEANVTAVIQPALVFIPQSEKGQPDGVATLGADGKVPPEQLPEMDVSTAMADFDTKDSLADADGIIITDSAETNTGKRVLWSKAKELLGKLYVPLSRKINNKALSADITLSAADVGAAAASHSHALDTLTGILPVNKGGTGQSSLEALLAALKQAGAVQISTGSYVGTGTYGADHPCSLTFDFLPSLIWLFGAGFSSMAWNSQTLANKSIVSPGDLTATFQKYPFPFAAGYQSSGGAYPYEYVLEHYAAFQNNTLRWYTKYTQKSGNSQPVEVDSAAYQLNTAGTEYGWIAFG